MEIWKEIRGYQNYMISNTGKVRSKERYDRLGRLNKGRLMSLLICTDGYLFVGLSKNSKKDKLSVHRLVASAFIPNYENKETVNHIDGNKQNNNVDNLEWNTRSENIQHAYDTGLKKPYNIKRVKNIETCEIFESGAAAAKKYNLHISTINSAANPNKNNITAGGYHWEYV